MINVLKIYISDSFDVYNNLAVEKYFLDSVRDDCCILYLWQNKSTVVIGRNQNPHAEFDLVAAEKENISVARRLSGGGCVFHDLGNLNFTFISHQKNYDLNKNMQVIQSACQMAGIDTEISGRNDILAYGRKFSGNAFYHSGERFYHHGTIMICTDIEKMQKLLTPTKAKLQSKGIKSVSSRVINLCELSSDLTCDMMIKHMIAAFEKVYGLKPDLIKEINSDKISSLAKEYSSWDYIYTKTPPYTFSNKGHFSWGNIEIYLKIEKGSIAEASIFTDSMDWELPQILQKCICGCKFRYNDISPHLFGELKEEVGKDIMSLLF